MNKSATEFALYPSNNGAWILDLSDGSVDWNNYNNNNYVRAVSAPSHGNDVGGAETRGLLRNG